MTTARDDAGRASVRCWRCTHPVDAADHYCRACGEGQGSALAWYYRPLWILVLSLTVLGPFALVLIMRTPRLGCGAKWIASMTLIALFAWVGWGIWVQTEAVLDAL